MAILIKLFLAFFKVGLFAIGGGYATLPLIEQEIVQKTGWLTPSTFNDLIAISQMTPGPIGLNAASFTGVYVAGIPGALIATFGCICPSLIIVSILAFLYKRYHERPAFRGAVAALRPLVLALIMVATIQLLKGCMPWAPWGDWAHQPWLQIATFAVLLVVAFKSKIKAIPLMLSGGVLGLVFYWIGL